MLGEKAKSVAYLKDALEAKLNEKLLVMICSEGAAMTNVTTDMITQVHRWWCTTLLVTCKKDHKKNSMPCKECNITLAASEHFKPEDTS